MFNDMILSEDGLAAGYIVIFDMQGVHLGHLAKVSLGAIRKFMIYIQVNGKRTHPSMWTDEVTILSQIIKFVAWTHKLS